MHQLRAGSVVRMKERDQVEINSEKSVTFGCTDFLFLQIIQVISFSPLNCNQVSICRLVKSFNVSS